ncbi:Glutathione S-transferase [Devosia enhydra]|uniref:Glutathione S-transferase n=1 Tax=Devosia enhydra TaxID=665118 RepID=A0A1K2HUY4_9HYPH|nr:glutathione S-transferase family protein [Devosia enhydra]SFZ82344.1 Glutathione S-transferase [Devosia enhydra]
MAITLWGRPTSSNVQKVGWALEELGVPYEQIPLGGRHGGTGSPDYVAMNPNKLVPTLRDGGLVIWESHAIVRYLAARYGAMTLWREDVAERAIVDQWTDWTATTFQPAWLAVFWLTVRTPVEKQDPAAIQAALKTAANAFSILDAQLRDRAFVAGGSMSYGDIVVGAALYRWYTMDIQRPDTPNVEAYYRRIRDRPAYTKTVCVSYEELRARSTP